MGNAIEDNRYSPSMMIHYNIDNGSSQVDALTESENSSAIANVAQYISKATGLVVEVTTGPLKSGSVKKIFYFSVHGDQNHVMQRLIITAIKKIFFEKIRSLSWDAILSSLEIDESNLISQLRRERKIMEDCWERLNRQKDVWTKRNTFFKALSYRPEIKSLEFSTGKYLQEDEAEYHIDAPQFSSYILEYDSEVTCDENAKVYIVSPVLIKNAKGRWHGLYNNCSIKINMTDSEFESQVQNGEIEFKSGFFIECKMEYEQYYNENQELVRNNYRVCEVYRYGVDGNMRTTPKKHFKRNDECQLELPFN